MRRATALLVLALAVSMFLPACGGESTYEFTDIRDREKPRVVVPPTTSAAQRFGFRDPRGASPGGDPHAGVPGMSGAPKTVFAWTTPEGWEEVQGSSSRDGSWRVAGEPQTDCSLSKLKGDGGGMVANVNRWLGQMGVGKLDAKGVAQLPRLKLLGKDAVYVSTPGRYGGGMGSKPIEEARMLGLILELPGTAVFLKFVGPTKVVEAQQGNFEKLAASIRIDASAPTQPTPTRQPAGSGRPEFTWTLPATWEDRKGRGGRVVTVDPKGAKDSECYLYLLGGDGGGIEMNINRWRGQMRQSNLSTEEIAKLERIDALGTKVVVLKIQGPFSGQSGEKIPGALLYGAVMLKEDYLLTAKMQGPADQMADEWDNFIAFCKSVQQK